MDNAKSSHDDDLKFRSLPCVIPRTEFGSDSAANMPSHSQVAVVCGDAHISYISKQLALKTGE